VLRNIPFFVFWSEIAKKAESLLQKFLVFEKKISNVTMEVKVFFCCCSGVKVCARKYQRDVNWAIFFCYKDIRIFANNAFSICFLPVFIISKQIGCSVK